jgi:hypothetical protein
MTGVYGVSQPAYRGALGHGAAYKGVTVVSVDTDKRMALARDEFGSFIEIRCDILRAKGNLPAPGEQWLIDQQYGQWTFAAIITGGTEGVIIPPDNVTGLTETLTDTDNRITTVADNALTRDNALDTRASTLETNTTNQALAKGDILAAPAAGALQRLAVGSGQQVLAVDPAMATGLRWVTPTALPYAVTGATQSGWLSGHTLAGAPTTGTHVVGEWVMDRNGVAWCCTVAGTPGTWVSQPSTRMTANETNITNLQNANQAFGRHYWYSNAGICAPGTEYVPPGYTAQYNDGIANIATASFRFNRAGRWGLTAACYSNSGAEGIMQFYLQQGNPSFYGGPSWVLSDRRYRKNGAGAGAWTNSGNLEQTISWTGWVTAAAAAVYFTPRVYWNCPTAGVAGNATDVNINVDMQYMGPN